MRKAASATVLIDVERRNRSGPIRPTVIIAVARVTGGASPTMIAYAHNTSRQTITRQAFRRLSADRPPSSAQAMMPMCKPAITSV